jgi:hypothetical protein
MPVSALDVIEGLRERPVIDARGARLIVSLGPADQSAFRWGALLWLAAAGAIGYAIGKENK